jgi:mannose-1-phosphate guanylyltransferase
MNIILLSGGSGKRLWPISNHVRSKQFLKLLKNNDEFESMVQRIWRQIKFHNLDNLSYISTSHSQASILKNQLGDQIPLIVEPERKDTFAAIALAVTYLHSVQNISPNETVCILPVDSYVKDDYFKVIKSLESVLIDSNANIALIGAQPTYPSSKYGYIIPHEMINLNVVDPFYQVKRFVEKPTEQEAENIILTENALWNCGVFAFKMEFILNILKNNGYSTDYNELLTNYSTLPKISFDYEIVEKESNIVVVPYNGNWKDLGTWNTLTEEMAHNSYGNAILSDECKNTHIVNELEIPVLSIGLTDIVIACSYDGILVTNKRESSKLKKYVENIKLRPMFEERSWGWYKVLNYSKYETNEVLTKKLMIKAGENISYQFHHHRDEIWTIVSGQGIFLLNGSLTSVKPNDVLQISQGDKHCIKANSDLEIIEVQIGSVLREDDIERLAVTWDEIKNFIQTAGEKSNE